MATGLPLLLGSIAQILCAWAAAVLRLNNLGQLRPKLICASGDKKAPSARQQGHYVMLGTSQSGFMLELLVQKITNPFD